MPGEVVERHIRERAPKSHPLSENQYHYQLGKSCESTLHSLFSKIEDATPEGEYTIGLFMNIEGAIDCVPLQKLCDVVNFI